jgi:phosphoribosylamine---glycine ligase
MMNVLLIGSGGREHALAWAISTSPLLANFYCAPGNAGIAEIAECVPIKAMDFDGILRFCQEKSIDFVVIGPDDPVVAGLADQLAAAGIKAFGPSMAAAQLEGSKSFTKELCVEANIPTAAYARFDDREKALAYVNEKGMPLVIKADGLALGKGVIMADTLDAAVAGVNSCFDGAFGAAGSTIIIEEMLVGEEASFFALCDGEHVLAMETAQDHKRAFNADQGPNTGGMGAYSPAPVMTPEMTRRTMDEIILPTVATMRARGTPFKGVLYAGLMITADGPKLIEYNVRFGDPECQVLMMRLQSDLLTLLLATAQGTLNRHHLIWREEAALTVVMATKGYPGNYTKGSEIKNLGEAASSTENVVIFHAGTMQDGNRILANGGRVLNVTAMGHTIAQAQARAYAAIRNVDWSDGFCRTDIGWRAIKREPQNGGAD